LSFSPALSPLRRRDFRLLFLGRLISFAGSAMRPLRSRVSAWDATGSLVLIPAAVSSIGPLADAIGVDATLWL